MKISVVIPVYNNEETIENCLNALISQDYNKKDFEIIVVNDGSTDKTGQILTRTAIQASKSGIRYRIITLPRNLGRALAREKGAEKADYQNILFIDSRNIAHTKLLAHIREINYQPLIGNSIAQPSTSHWDRFYYLIRNMLYKPYFGSEFKPLTITPKNFDRAPKGTTVFFCDKRLFLASQLTNKKSKHCSDDTALLWNIVRKKPIVRHSAPKAVYVARQSWKLNWLHMFNRGPKFIDYYFHSGRRYYLPILIFLSILLFWLLLSFMQHAIFFIGLFLAIIFFIFAPLLLCENDKDYLIILFRLPFITIAFGSGILKGIALKLFRRY